MFHRELNVDIYRKVAPSGNWDVRGDMYSYSHSISATYQPFSSLASLRERQMFANVTGLLTVGFNTDIQDDDELVVYDRLAPSGQYLYQRVATIEPWNAVIPHLEVYVTYTQWDRR